MEKEKGGERREKKKKRGVRRHVPSFLLTICAVCFSGDGAADRHARPAPNGFGMAEHLSYCALTNPGFPPPCSHRARSCPTCFVMGVFPFQMQRAEASPSSTPFSPTNKPFVLVVVSPPFFSFAFPVAAINQSTDQSIKHACFFSSDCSLVRFYPSPQPVAAGSPLLSPTGPQWMMLNSYPGKSLAASLTNPQLPSKETKK